MRYRPAFLPLIIRPAMFVWGLLCVVMTTLAILGLSDSGSTHLVDADAAVLASIGYPLVAGILAGGALREFQHGSFAWALPDGRRQSAIGFLVFGLVTAGLIVLIILGVGTAHHALPLVVLGWVFFCFGATFVHPASNWVAAICVLMTLAAMAKSDSLGQLVDAWPVVSSVVLLVLVGALTRHLFSRAIFRSMPSRTTAPVSGAFSLRRSERNERQRMLERARNRSLPSRRQLGDRPWPWVGAAVYQNYGAEGWRVVFRVLSRLALLFALITAHAAFDHTDELPTSIFKSIHDALFQPPHLPQYGEHPPYMAVILWIAAIGIGVVMMMPVRLRTGMLYPLDRRQRACVAYRGGLLELAGYAALMSTILLVVGYLAGWLVGYEFRVDFIPFFVRPLLVTLILLPLVQYVGVRGSLARSREDVGSVAVLVTGVIAFAFVVLIWSIASPPVVSLTEIGILGGLLVLSQLLYRSAVYARFRHSDLA